MRIMLFYSKRHKNDENCIAGVHKGNCQGDILFVADNLRILSWLCGSTDVFSDQSACYGLIFYHMEHLNHSVSNLYAIQ